MTKQEAALLHALEVLREKYGSLNKGAKALGKARQTINHWKLKGQVSHRDALRLSEETGVSVHDLRPDVFGPSKHVGNGSLKFEMHSAA